MLENCDKIFVSRWNEEILNGENILNYHLRGQDTNCERLKCKLGNQPQLNLSSLILKMKDSRMERVIGNAYQLQLDNLIICTMDSLPILY